MTNRNSSYLVITDLDGTLLDHYTYSWLAAAPALALLRDYNIPVVINTSKTASEVISLQQDLGVDAPFIVENGSAIYLPPQPELETFSSEFSRPQDKDLLKNRFKVKILGQQKSQIVESLLFLREKYKLKFEGFSDWSPEKIAEVTGLSIEAAKQASIREFSEPILWQDSKERFREFSISIENLGLKILQGGRFTHILGNTNKGAAALWLKKFYESYSTTNYKLITLGDGPNDLEMLEVSDFAVLIKSPAHNFPEFDSRESTIYTENFGPEGWNEAITKLKPIIS